MLGENGTLIGGLGPEQSRKDQGSKLHRCCLEGSYAHHYTTDAFLTPVKNLNKFFFNTTSLLYSLSTVCSVPDPQYM